MNSHSISVVIPCYNEEANVAKTITDIAEKIPAIASDYEIIAVNDGSSDATGSVIRALVPSVSNLRIVEHFPNRGYGGALKAGFAAASKDVIVFAPGDGQFDFAEAKLLLDRLVPGIVLVSGIRENRKDNAVRKFNAFLWNCAVRSLFGKLVTDIDCGFKAFRRSALSGISIESDGAMVDTEMLATLKSRGLKFDEVPVTHLPRTAGNPTGANLLVIMKAFRDLAAVRIRLWKTKKSA